LIVDDVSDAAESLALLVGLWGHRPVVAADGPAALRVARAESPDVVLLDLGLLGMNGCEVARRLRQEAGPGEALLVAVIGYADGGHRRLADEAGLDLSLVKPVELDALERLLGPSGVSLPVKGDSGGAPRLRPPPPVIFREGMMMARAKLITFDVDAASLSALREALPGWDIEATAGATVCSLERDWSAGPADLLVVGDHEDRARRLGLCQGLRSQPGRAETPLLVLVAPARETLVRAALSAGATSCLVLPVHPKEVARMVARPRTGNQPGRHTLNLDRPQREDPWQDEGGEA
jgi:CheY-like chemotaxis protein